MIRSLLTPLLLLLAAAQTAPVPAVAPPTHAPAKVAPTRDADPALWVVRDRDTTIYLFGTIHVLKPGLSWFDEAVKKAFDRSDTLVLELVQPDAAAMQALVAKLGINPPGTPPLTQQLSAADRPAYTKLLGELGMKPDALDRMRPWLAAVQLSLGPVTKAGYDPGNGPESVLTAAAKAEHKPVIGLETAEQQLGYLSGISQKGQVAFLVSSVKDAGKAPQELSEMVDDWSRGDPKALAAIMNDGIKDTPEVADVLLRQRNARWAKWIKARLAKPGTVFVAVGAGHLAGTGSVQDDLAKLSVKVARVRY